MDATTIDALRLTLEILTGIGLAAACGLRAFLPMLAMGGLQRAGFLALGSHFEWLGSTPALVAFGTAVVVEVLGDKFPVLDHALDSVGIVVKPLAGAILASAAIVDMDPWLSAALGLITGASVTGAVHVAKSGVRVVSTSLTGGLANPVISTVEDVLGIVLTAIAIVAPFLVLGMLAMMVFVTYQIVQRRRRVLAPVPVTA